MQYQQNDIPVCPHCNEAIECYVDEKTPEGVQNIALHHSGNITHIECDWCYEEITVRTIVAGETYEVTD